jgi:hypothetical protein
MMAAASMFRKVPSTEHRLPIDHDAAARSTDVRVASASVLHSGAWRIGVMNT